MPGDKVQILAGPDKGKVSQIMARHEEGNSYLVDGVNGTQTFPIPPAMAQEGQTTHVIEFPNPLKQSELRLVAQRPEEDGTTTEVAIAAVECVGTYYDPAYKRVLPDESWPTITRPRCHGPLLSSLSSMWRALPSEMWLENEPTGSLLWSSLLSPSELCPTFETCTTSDSSDSPSERSISSQPPSPSSPRAPRAFRSTPAQEA